MMQFFEWYLPNDGLWWKRCSAKADNLTEQWKKRMEPGKKFAGELFYDAMGECTEPVTVDDDGWCDFYCNGNSVSVWVRAKAFEYLAVNE